MGLKDYQQKEFEEAFRCRNGYPDLIENNKKDPGYDAALWAWTYQQNRINGLEQILNDLRRALRALGI